MPGSWPTERGPKPAEQAAQEAVEADAESSTAWAALGLAQFRLHRREEAEASLRRALQLNPNDIYAQSAMVALLQDRHDDGKAEALAGLLGEHAGTEDLVAAVRDNAKQRRIARMLVERKVDLDGTGRRAAAATAGSGCWSPATLGRDAVYLVLRSLARDRCGALVIVVTCSARDDATNGWNRSLRIEEPP